MTIRLALVRQVHNCQEFHSPPSHRRNALSVYCSRNCYVQSVRNRERAVKPEKKPMAHGRGPATLGPGERRIPIMACVPAGLLADIEAYRSESAERPSRSQVVVDALAYFLSQTTVTAKTKRSG